MKRNRIVPALAALALAVATWVAGFDVLYALQDVGFDTEHGLYSVPVAFGEGGALLIARALHLVTIVALVACTLAVRMLALPVETIGPTLLRLTRQQP